MMLDKAVLDFISGKDFFLAVLEQFFFRTAEPALYEPGFG